MADLIVTHTESLTLNGTQQGGTNSVTIGSIANVFKRIITVAASNDTTLVSFHSDQHDDDGTIDVNDVKYLRVTNLATDAAHICNLNLQIEAGEDDSAADESSTILLGAGHSFVMGATADALSVDDDAATPDVTLHHLESIIADTVSTAVQLEVFIATV
tara:strand:- start:29664 stop:30140 length:477 start_codon:yes stop_codon:yes gene_type:complete